MVWDTRVWEKNVNQFTAKLSAKQMQQFCPYLMGNRKRRNIGTSPIAIEMLWEPRMYYNILQWTSVTILYAPNGHPWPDLGCLNIPSFGQLRPYFDCHN